MAAKPRHSGCDPGVEREWQEIVPKSEGVEIGGFVDALDTACYEHDRVTTIERMPLGGFG